MNLIAQYCSYALCCVHIIRKTLNNDYVLVRSAALWLSGTWNDAPYLRYPLDLTGRNRGNNI